MHTSFLIKLKFSYPMRQREQEQEKEKRENRGNRGRKGSNFKLKYFNVQQRIVPTAYVVPC